MSTKEIAEVFAKFGVDIDPSSPDASYDDFLLGDAAMDVASARRELIEKIKAAQSNLDRALKELEAGEFRSNCYGILQDSGRMVDLFSMKFSTAIDWFAKLCYARKSRQNASKSA